MSNFTLQQVAGDNSVQDSDTITYAKADLTQNTGLTALDENDGEQVIAATVLQWLSLGIDTDHRDGTDELEANFTQQIAINPVVTTFISRLDDDGNSVWFKRDSYTIDFDKPLGTVNPNDY